MISGGGSGIGSAVAEKLAAAQVITAIADLHAPEQSRKSTHFFTCDVTDASAIDGLFTDVQQQVGSPDILVCSAGLGVHEKLTEGDPDKWQHVINTNLMGTLRLIRAFVPAMLEAGYGDVVIVSSVSAGQAYPYGGVYAATKTALEIVAETLRHEVLPTIRVTVVAPGVTDTAFFKNTLSGSQTAESIGYGALTAGQVADAVLFALMQPPGVSINHITLRPTAQGF
ncbi:SDR family oxidoreductase [Pontibacter akesuensis]|uniref:SDR family oxidoreductase n=1 Tax=Pontibacter akesuensis TaxID=388950 RepID=UPI001560A5A9|nr:SDR family NAD(P)-dependent oxidoreductase [Pontibacter akesuensis]GHA53616.1 oxidoreductase [Pontibacter akesuensis]